MTGDFIIAFRQNCYFKEALNAFSIWYERKYCEIHFYWSDDDYKWALSKRVKRVLSIKNAIKMEENGFSFLISKDRVKHQVFCSLRGTCKYSRTTWKKNTLTQAHNKSKMEIEKSIKRKFIFDSSIWSRKRELPGVCGEFLFS